MPIGYYAYVKMLHGFWANSQAPGISDPLSLISSEKMGVSETWCHFSAFQNFCLALDVWHRWKASILGAL